MFSLEVMATHVISTHNRSQSKHSVRISNRSDSPGALIRPSVTVDMGVAIAPGSPVADRDVPDNVIMVLSRPFANQNINNLDKRIKYPLEIDASLRGDSCLESCGW